VTGRKKLSAELGITQQTIRTCLNHLKSTNEITVEPTNKFSIITVCNYNSYQSENGRVNQQKLEATNQQLTNNQPTTNQQLTTIEEGKEREEDILPGNPGSDLCPHQKIIDVYHKSLPELPPVKIWSDERKKQLRARWRMGAKYQTVEYWQSYFGYVRESPFLMGEKNGFTADLEWLVKKSNFIKVIEGKYHGKK